MCKTFREGFPSFAVFFCESGQCNGKMCGGDAPVPARVDWPVGWKIASRKMAFQRHGGMEGAHGAALAVAEGRKRAVYYERLRRRPRVRNRQALDRRVAATRSSARPLACSASCSALGGPHPDPGLVQAVVRLVKRGCETRLLPLCSGIYRRGAMETSAKNFLGCHSSLTTFGPLRCSEPGVECACFYAEFVRKNNL